VDVQTTHYILYQFISNFLLENLY